MGLQSPAPAPSPSNRMQRFISDDELAAIEQRGSHAEATAADALLLAWHLRQRDSERAVALAHRWAASPGLADALRGVAHLVAGEHAYLRDDAASAAASVAQARAAFAACDCRSGLSDASVLESAVFGAAGDYAGRRRLMRQSIDEASDDDDERRLFGEISLCCLAALSDPQAALIAHGDTMHPHTESSWLGPKMMAHSFFSYALLGTERHAERIEHGTLAWRTALSAGALMRAVLEAANVAGSYLDLNDNASAVEQVQVGLDIARRHHWPQPLARCLTLLAEALLRLGRREGALEFASEALALVGNAQDSKAYAIALHVAANVHLAYGHFADAERKYQALTADRGVSDLREMVRYGHLGLAQARLAAGNPALAVAPAELALAGATAAGDHALEVEALRTLAKAALQLRAAGTDDPPCGAPLDHLKQAAALMQDGGHRLSGLLAEQADAHEALGDLHAALAAMRQSADAQREQVVRDATTRAANLELKLRSERALAAAEHQAELARVETERAGELERLNAQLRSTMAALEVASSQLLKRNEALNAANSQIQALSMTDPLTGLRNRRFLGEVIETDVAQCLRAFGDAARTKSMAPLHADIVFYLIDLDHFKAVNDEHGHTAGDELLMQVSQRLTSVTRDHDYVVRWGGEEFLVVTRGADRQTAPVLAERLRLAIANLPFELPSGPRLSKTCSIGYAAFPLDRNVPSAAGWAAAVDLADQRLYAAKHAGRNRWVGDTGVDSSPAG